MRISVDNDGRETEHFSLAQAGGCSSGEFLNIGDDQFVKDGDTKAIDFPICINQEGISGRFTPGARYATSIFLRDIRGGGAPLLGIFEGSTPADNWTNVSFPAARLRAITVTLDQLVVNDDMDNASPGDWHVRFDVANFSGAEAPHYGMRIGGPPFPNPTGTQNVSTHTTVPIGRSVSFSRFRKAKLSLWKSASPIATRTRRSGGSHSLWRQPRLQRPGGILGVIRQP
jgi:hypothetical protein